MDLETPIAVTPQISDKANKKIQWYVSSQKLAID